MKPSATRDENLLRRLLANSDESAAAALFMQLYRLSPPLRQWLREDYARDGALRDRFDEMAKKDRQVTRFAELTGDNRAWLEEQRRLKAIIPLNVYGGLTWQEVVHLVQEYQAGRLDLGAYLFARHWRKAKKPSPFLMWAGLALLESVLPAGRRRLLKHLSDALTFIKKYEDKAQGRSAVGSGDWWKMNTLIYILRHPRPSYSTRELRAHLAKIGLNVSAKEMRRFCGRHGIKRDMLPGRPRRRGAEKALVLQTRSRD